MSKVVKLLPMALFCLYFSKVMVQSPTAIEASILGILATFVAYLEYKNNDKKLEAIEKSLIEFKADLDFKQKEIEGLKSTTTGLKMASGMKSMGSR